MNQVPRHKVFISHHDADRVYKKRFIQMMGDLIVDTSVDEDDIDDTNLARETIRREIRDDYIRQASVTIVLLGPCTWQRMHVDWEIGSSIRKTKRNPRCGLLGILLPNHSNHGRKRNLHLIPPRLADNYTEDDPYALIYDWPRPWAPAKIAQWIHRAFVRRDVTPPDNSRAPFAGNRSRGYRKGWQ